MSKRPPQQEIWQRWFSYLRDTQPSIAAQLNAASQYAFYEIAQDVIADTQATQRARLEPCKPKPIGVRRRRML